MGETSSNINSIGKWGGADPENVLSRDIQNCDATDDRGKPHQKRQTNAVDKQIETRLRSGHHHNHRFRCLGLGYPWTTFLVSSSDNLFVYALMIGLHIVT